MVIRKDLENKFALISVFNKDGLKNLCHGLDKYNYKFISTGSTGNKIRDMGFKCKDVSKITKYKEMFDGRVKTIVTVSHFSTDIVRPRAELAKSLGADIIMMMPPYHGALLKGNPDQIFEQFK